MKSEGEVLDIKNAKEQLSAIAETHPLEVRKKQCSLTLEWHRQDIIRRADERRSQNSKRTGDWKMEEETLEADAVLEKAAAERDYQHRLNVADNHRKVQLGKVASKRQKEQEAF